MALEERLRREGWYLGKVTEEAAESVLQSCPRFNIFVVYSKPGGTGYVLSARFHVNDLDEDTLEHIQISPTEEGQYQLPGQAEASDDIISAVNSYVTERDPPLKPALSKSFEKQLSAADDPPSYSEAHRALAPDIAPLPDIAAVSVEPVTEATTGDISSTSSPEPCQQTGRGSSDRASPRVNRWRSPNPPQPYVPSPTPRRRDNSDNAPPHLSNPHWYRYQDHCCLHPKNCWHCCCYRETYWTGYREKHKHKWYSLQGTGPLRLVGLALFWILCGNVISCGVCCAYCVYVFCMAYHDSYDDD